VAGDEFAAGVAALLAASSAQGSCRAVHAIVTSGDDLTAPLRRHVRRHMRHCARCAERGRRDLRPAVLAGLLPGTVLPSTLRQQVMDVLTGSSQQAAAARAVVTVRAEPFDRTGFPVLIEWLAAPRERPAHLPVAGALVAVFALFGGGGVYVASTLHHGPARSPAPAVPSVQAGPAGSAPAALPAVRRPAQRAGHAAIRPLLAATSQLSPSSTSAGPSRSAAQPTASSRGTSSPKPTSKASPTPSPSQASSPPPPIPTPTPTPSPSASLTVTQAPGPSLLVSLAGRLGL
jgi:hypothetical protein